MVHLRALRDNLCHALVIGWSWDCSCPLAGAVLPGQMLLQTPTLSFSGA